MIVAAEKTEQRRKEERLLHYAREGKAEEVTNLVRTILLLICINISKLPDIGYDVKTFVPKLKKEENLKALLWRCEDHVLLMN